MSDPLAFAPSPASIGFPQSDELADTGPYGERLDRRNLAQNLEVHQRIVSKPSSTVKRAERAIAAVEAEAAIGWLLLDHLVGTTYPVSLNP